MLKKFSDDERYPHLISLLLTYEQNDNYFLLFDWAECNLKGYWEHVQPQPSASHRETVLWVGEQCRGIAHGIAGLHEYRTPSLSQVDQAQTIVVFGHHGDIKEENILWFPDRDKSSREANRGILKLADFGLAKFCNDHTASRGPSARFAATPSYRAPESDQDKAQGRSYDIWTLGILYLQFCTSLIGGWTLLQEFKEMRKCPDPGWYGIDSDTFFTLHSEAKTAKEKRHIIKPVVTQVTCSSPSPLLHVPLCRP